MSSATSAYFKPFWIKGIKFHCLIKLKNAFATFGVNITSSKAIDKIILYVELFCKESNTYIKGTKKLKFNGGKKREWTIPFGKKRLNKIWLNANYWKQQDALKFLMYIHIKQIHFTDSKKFESLTLYERAKIQQSVFWEWYMSKKLMIDIKSVCIDGKRVYFSPNFGIYNTWYIKFKPDKDAVYITLLYRSFPPNIKDIELKYSIVLKLDGKTYCRKKCGWVCQRNHMGTEIKFDGVDWVCIVSAQSIAVMIKLTILKSTYFSE